MHLKIVVRGGNSGISIRIVILLSLPLVGHPVHFLLLQPVNVDHVPAHVVNGGESLLADGARGLPSVFLHVRDETLA